MDQPPDQPPDLLELLQADHRRVNELVASNASGPELVREIESHLVAESQLLYPLLRRRVPEVDVAVDRLLEIDHRLEELLADVDRSGNEHLAVPGLDELFVEHVRQQEPLLSELRRVAEPEELRRLGATLGPTLMHAPTHAHPHLPREGTFEVIGDAVASSVDHLRDALRRDDHET